MGLRRAEWPDVGDFVIATVERITDYGAYVRLDEYNKEGLLHVSEVASRWVRNIRDYVREGQKVVLKVLRVQAAKGQVDLSRRRVTRRDKNEKLLAWKKDRKAESLLRTAAEKLNISFEEVYQNAGELIESFFGELYEGLEKTAKDGIDVLLKLGISKELAAIIEEVAKEMVFVGAYIEQESLLLAFRVASHKRAAALLPQKLPFLLQNRQRLAQSAPRDPVLLGQFGLRHQALTRLIDAGPDLGLKVLGHPLVDEGRA